jgi:hypothetical protein
MSFARVAGAPSGIEVRRVLERTPSLLVLTGTHLGQPVSMVTVRPDLPRFADRARDFALASRRLARFAHPALLPVRALFDTANGPMVLTAPLTGAPLARFLRVAHRQHRAVPARTVMRVVTGLASGAFALAALRPKAPLSGLSADAVWIRPDGQGLLLPSVCSDPSLIASTCGRLERAPELDSGRGDPRSDVYSLALVAWTLLSVGASAPFDARETRSMREVAPDGVVKLILRSLGAPEDRPKDVRAFAAELLRAADPHAARSGAAHRHLCVSVVRGGAHPREVVLPCANTRWLAGRAATADVSLNDPDVSRRHLEITLTRAGSVVVRDLASKNGVFVNEVRTGECPVSSADLVRVGTTILRFCSSELLGPFGPVADAQKAVPRPVCRGKTSKRQEIEANRLDEGRSVP